MADIDVHVIIEPADGSLDEIVSAVGVTPHKIVLRGNPVGRRQLPAEQTSISYKISEQDFVDEQKILNLAYDLTRKLHSHCCDSIEKIKYFEMCIVVYRNEEESTPGIAIENKLLRIVAELGGTIGLSHYLH